MIFRIIGSQPFVVTLRACDPNFWLIRWRLVVSVFSWCAEMQSTYTETIWKMIAVYSLPISVTICIIMCIIMCSRINSLTWSIWFLFLSISIWFERIRNFEKKILFQNFVLRLILHAKFSVEQKFRIYKKRFWPKFHNWNRSNSIFEIWWFMKNVKFLSISVSSWFDDFFRSIYFDVLTLIIFVLMRCFKISQKFFLIIISTELFFSFIYLISIISRFL